ncbi:MAG: chloride channel protein [Clostridiales bacterium]|nr:chloride channel protein [Clostridiales bacterium]
MKKLLNAYGTLILPGLLGIPAGAAIGAVDTLFGRVLLEITDVRNSHPFWFIPFLAIAGILITWCYSRFGGKSAKGMGLIFEAGHGQEKNIPLRLIPFVISGTWLTHLFGGSAGREGVAVQIGAALAHGYGKALAAVRARLFTGRVLQPADNTPGDGRAAITSDNAAKSVQPQPSIAADNNDLPGILLVAGMAAGFAGLFQTPIAAIFFALEVLVAGELRYRALFPAFTAAFTASAVSGALGLEKFTFALSQGLGALAGSGPGNTEPLLSLNPAFIFKLILLGMIFGIVGGAFAWALKSAKHILQNKFKNPLVRIAVSGIALSILFLILFKGRYCGLGTNLIESSFDGGSIYSFDWLMKFLLTILTLSAGFQGGEVTPLFSIGASLGVILAPILGLPAMLTAALGYAAVFGGATNTLLASVFIGAEVFGCEWLPCFFVVCVISYLFNHNKSIYTLQKLSAAVKGKA